MLIGFKSFFPDPENYFQVKKDILGMKSPYYIISRK